MHFAPGSTFAVLITAPTPVITAQPNKPADVKVTPLFVRTLPLPDESASSSPG